MAEPGVPVRARVFQNGMVMVFDANGQQCPEYQGRYADVVAKIAAAEPPIAWTAGMWQRREQQGSAARPGAGTEL